MKKTIINRLIFTVITIMYIVTIPDVMADCTNNNSSYTCTGIISGDNNGVEINHTDLTNIILNQLADSTISGNYNGILIDNYGNGSLTITSSGDISGRLGGTGINAINYENATDLIIEQIKGTISGSQGIRAFNSGTGDTTVTSKGIITKETDYSSYGITIQNGMSSNNIIVNVEGIIETTSGISIQNNGYGNTSVTVSGDITDVSLMNMSNTGKLTFTLVSGSVKGNGSYGIQAMNAGKADTDITLSGNVSGYINGVFVSSYGGESGDLIIKQESGTISNTLSGDAIRAENYGLGQTVIDISGNVTGKNGSGISVRNNTSTTGDIEITQSQGSVISTDLASGIKVENNNATAKTLMTLSGTIIGGNDSYYGSGIYTTGTNGQIVNITLNDGANVSSVLGIAIQDDVGNATVTLNRGSKVTGAILLNAGSDTLTINNGADVTKATIFDGGTATGATSITDTDTDTDILNINQSLTGSSNATTSGVAGDIFITNWEQINIGSGNSANNDTGAILSLSGDVTAKSVTTKTNGTINLATTLTSATINGDLTNGGSIDLSSNNATGDTLIINGNYIGNNGSLVLDSVLGADNSATDKLVITGNVFGTTYVSINKIGGSGAATVEGIEIVEVAGTSDKDAFIKNGRIVAGSYEYNVVQGNASGTDTNNWYLSSTYLEPTPEPIPDNTKKVSVIRPEAGAYIANLASANTLFNTTLHDRLGETQYTDLLTGEKLVTSMWIRSVVGQNRFVAGHGQFKNKTNWSLVQLGGDIAQWSSNDSNRLHLGLMAGYSRSSSDTDSKLSGYSANGSIDGYSLGLYGTWYDNDADKSGLYVDSWVLWNHFNAKVHGQELSREKYKLKGITASVESGYTFKLGKSELYNYGLQPKAQVTYMGVDADNHTESNGTKVKADANNWQSRLGVRLSANTNDLYKSKHSSAGQLFIEANWLHNTEPFSVSMDGSHVSQDGARNIAEIKTGVEANILTNTNVWFNLNYQRGDHDYRNLGAMLGAKYSF